MGPPEAIETIASSGIPLTNTFFLLSSGVTVTWAHHAIISRAKKHAIIALLWTLVLAVMFTGLQALEYIEAPFTITDSVFGSCFYITTGFHGFHVFIGTCFLFVSFTRIILNHLQICIFLDLKLVHGIGILLGRPIKNLLKVETI